jgi:hypothetical protein
MRNRIYVVTDVEIDGPNPGRHSSKHALAGPDGALGRQGY